ncbi:MAG: hypothetical protein DRJ60_05060 [Thermoprotei archaeon]|nr:MAG: hypothetical protein DRJ60_05060 [Thermoprotei archaeon]
MVQVVGNPMTIGIFIAYLVIMLIIGFVFAGKIRDIKDYFIGGRKIGFWELNFTLIATIASAMTYVGVAGAAYSWGWPFLWETFWPAVALVITTMVLGPRLYRIAKRHDLVTVVDYLELRYERSKAVRGIASIIAIILTAIYLMGQYKAMAMTVQSLIGWDYFTALTVGAIILIVYSVLGGLYAVAVTDFVQLLIMILGILLLLPTAISLAGGIETINTTLKSIEPWMVEIFAPKGPGSPPLLFSLFVVVALSLAAMPHVSHRHWMGRRYSYYRWLPLVGFVIYFAVHMSVKWWGLSGRALVAQGILPPPADPDRILPDMIIYVAHPVIAGILLAAVASAVMSTVDSLLLVASATVARDIYQMLIKPTASERSMVWISRITTLALGFITYAIVISPPGLIMWLVWASLGICASTFVPLFFGGLFWRRPNKVSAIITMIVGLIAALFFGYTNKYLGWNYIIYPFAWSMIIGIVTYIITSLVTKPPSKEYLDQVMPTKAKAAISAIKSKTTEDALRDVAFRVFGTKSIT